MSIILTILIVTLIMQITVFIFVNSKYNFYRAILNTINIENIMLINGRGDMIIDKSRNINKNKDENNEINNIPNNRIYSIYIIVNS